jgi:hypothetical protein
MKEKKSKSNWYIAAVHYLIAGVIAPFLLSLVFVFLIVPFFKIQSKPLMILFSSGFRIFAIWVGVMSSAGYLAENYTIKDKKSVVNFATIYFFVLSGVSAIDSIIDKSITGINLIYSLVAIVVLTVLFYIFSKKYI